MFENDLNDLKPMSNVITYFVNNLFFYCSNSLRLFLSFSHSSGISNSFRRRGFIALLWPNYLKKYNHLPFYFSYPHNYLYHRKIDFLRMKNKALTRGDSNGLMAFELF